MPDDVPETYQLCPICRGAPLIFAIENGGICEDCGGEGIVPIPDYVPGWQFSLPTGGW